MSPPRDSDHGGDAAVDIGVGGGPAGNADAHGGAALPDGDAAPAGAVVLKFFDDALGFFGVAEGDEDLVEDDIVQDLEATAETEQQSARAFWSPPRAKLYQIPNDADETRMLKAFEFRWSHCALFRTAVCRTTI